MPVYFHNGSHYDFTFIMKLIASYETAHPSDNCLEVIPTSEDKEMQIEFRGIQFHDSLKLINSPLKTIVAQTLGNNLDHYGHTKLNSSDIVSHVVNNGVTSTSIC